MINGECLDLFLNNITTKSFLSDKFIEKLFITLKREENFRYLKSISVSDKRLPFYGEYTEGTIIFYRRCLNNSYHSRKEMLVKYEDNTLVKNIYYLFTIIHELAHAYQEAMSSEVLRKLCMLSYSIKEGDRVSNSFTKVLDSYSFNLFSNLVKRNIGNKMYLKNHDIFPMEVHADGMSYDFILTLYNILGKECFDNFNNLKEFICKKIMNNYYYHEKVIINPLNRFLRLINMEELKNELDFSFLSNYEKVLFGLEDNSLVVKEEIEKILAK